MTLNSRRSNFTLHLAEKWRIFKVREVDWRRWDSWNALKKRSGNGGLHGLYRNWFHDHFADKRHIRIYFFKKYALHLPILLNSVAQKLPNLTTYVAVILLLYGPTRITCTIVKCIEENTLSRCISVYEMDITVVWRRHVIWLHFISRQRPFNTFLARFVKCGM
jgi:hypothetical protein